MSAIYLIRHAESTANAGGLSQPNPEVALTDKGKIQAQELAERLELVPTKVVVSNFIRTQQTAQPWLDKLGISAEVDPLIREFDVFGYSLIEGMTGEQRRPLAQQYWHTPDLDKRCGEDGETFAEFAARVTTFLHHLSRYEHNSVLFSHGMFMRLVIWRLLGYPMQTNVHLCAFRKFITTMNIPNTGVFCLQWRDGFTDAGIRIIPEFSPDCFALVDQEV